MRSARSRSASASLSCSRACCAFACAEVEQRGVVGDCAAALRAISLGAQRGSSDHSSTRISAGVASPWPGCSRDHALELGARRVVATPTTGRCRAACVRRCRSGAARARAQQRDRLGARSSRLARAPRRRPTGRSQGPARAAGSAAAGVGVGAGVRGRGRAAWTAPGRPRGRPSRARTFPRRRATPRPHEGRTRVSCRHRPALGSAGSPSRLIFPSAPSGGTR